MAKRTKARQVEIEWGEPEAFALVIEQAQDGERIAAEQAQREQDRALSEALQLDWEA
jgi:hypothetical protein